MAASQNDNNDVTFLEALYLKYCDDSSLDEIELPQNDGHKRVCQYVGFDSLIDTLKNVTNLSFINLANMNISSCGLIDREKFRFPKARSLDLALNKLSSWRDVSQIVNLTEYLSDLILTSNPLLAPTDEEVATANFNSLRVIVLGNLSYSWKDVCKCALLWPNIEKLNLFHNNITALSSIDDILNNLTFISLSGNPISDWREICKLGTLSRLETLELSSCQISSISFDDLGNSAKIDLFPELKYLDLINNQINDWKSVAQLNRLKQLNSLLLKRNPIYDLNRYHFNYNYVISRVSGLKTLDREPVTNELRNDGEKYYLRTIYPEYIQKTDPSSKKLFLEENPCLLKLLEKFGEPVVEKKLTKQDKIKQNYLVLKINDSDNPVEGKKIIEKKVPKSTKVSNLKFILRRLLKIGLSQDFDLIISSKDYKEEMQDRDDIDVYRIDVDHIIQVKRL